MAIASITKSAIERLIKKISVKVLPQFYIDKPIRVNSIIYEETRVKIQNFLQRIIDDSCTIATFMGKKTVSSSCTTEFQREIISLSCSSIDLKLWKPSSNLKTLL